MIAIYKKSLKATLIPKTIKLQMSEINVPMMNKYIFSMILVFTSIIGLLVKRLLYRR